MLDAAFDMLVLLPSMAIAYSVLYTFYGWRRAYESICWIPIVIWLSVAAFLPWASYEAATGPNLYLLLNAVEWTSLIQGSVGVCLLVIAVRKREPFFALALATIAASLPFITRLLFAGL